MSYWDGDPPGDRDEADAEEAILWFWIVVIAVGIVVVVLGGL